MSPIQFRPKLDLTDFLSTQANQGSNAMVWIHYLYINPHISCCIQINLYSCFFLFLLSPAMKLFLCSLLCLLFVVSQVNALPVQHAFVPSSLAQGNSVDAQEYTVYNSAIEYYENLVDTTLSSESEELLINLIHLPKESMKNILTLQAESMGFKAISGKEDSLFWNFR